jgi:hypothetical protein
VNAVGRRPCGGGHQEVSPEAGPLVESNPKQAVRGEPFGLRQASQTVDLFARKKNTEAVVTVPLIVINEDKQRRQYYDFSAGLDRMIG